MRLRGVCVCMSASACFLHASACFCVFLRVSACVCVRLRVSACVCVRLRAQGVLALRAYELRVSYDVCME